MWDAHESVKCDKSTNPWRGLQYDLRYQYALSGGLVPGAYSASYDIISYSRYITRIWNIIGIWMSQSVTVNRLNSPHRKMTRASSQWLQLFHPTKHFLKFSRVSYPSGHSDYLSACETRHGLPLQEPRDCESFEGRLESATISGAVQEPWQATDSHPSVVGTQGKGWNERTS